MWECSESWVPVLRFHPMYKHFTLSQASVSKLLFSQNLILSLDTCPGKADSVKMKMFGEGTQETGRSSAGEMHVALCGVD